MAVVALLSAGSPAATGWRGVDETVVERIARDAGRAPWRPLLDTSHGDLALFAFLWAGILGGAVFGYCLRMIVVEPVDGDPTGERDDAR